MNDIEDNRIAVGSYGRWTKAVQRGTVDYKQRNTVMDYGIQLSLQGGKKEHKKEMAKIEEKRSTEEKDEEERNKRGEEIDGEIVESLVVVRWRNWYRICEAANGMGSIDLEMTTLKVVISFRFEFREEISKYELLSLI